MFIIKTLLKALAVDKEIRFIIIIVRYILGWPKKTESAPISVLACAHMRMGIGNYHTDFGDIWSSQSSAICCQPKGVPW